MNFFKNLHYSDFCLNINLLDISEWDCWVIQEVHGWLSEKPPNWFLRGLLLFSFLTKIGESSSCFTSLPVIFYLFVCFSFSHISRSVVVSHCSFDLDFAINEVGYLLSAYLPLICHLWWSDSAYLLSIYFIFLNF